MFKQAYKEYIKITFLIFISFLKIVLHPKIPMIDSNGPALSYRSVTDIS